MLRAAKCSSDSRDDLFKNFENNGNIFFSLCVFYHIPVSVAVGLESLAAQLVVAARPVPGSWMVKRPDKEASLTL